MKLAYAIQSVKQWSKSAKDGVGTNLFWLKGTDFIQGKKQQNIPTRKQGLLGYVGCQYQQVSGLLNPAVKT